MDFGKRNPEVKGNVEASGGSAPTQGRTSGQVATTLGEDTEFQGNMKFGNSLKIEGKFQGDLESKGHLIVGASGHVKAGVNVSNLTVEGKLTGNIDADDLVDLRSTAEVFGDVKAAKIKIEEGVVFVGKANIRPKESKSKPISAGASADTANPTVNIAGKNDNKEIRK